MKVIVKQFEELSNMELYDIMNLRQIVFIMEQNCCYLDCDYKDIESTHIMTYIEDKLVGYCRVLPQGVVYDEASIGRVVSHPDYRRQNIGYNLLDKALEVLRNQFNTTKCTISAQTYLLSFYEKYGFKAEGEEYLEDTLPHFKMKKI